MARPQVSLGVSTGVAVLAGGVVALLYAARPASGVSVPRGIAIVVFVVVALGAIVAIGQTGRTYSRYLKLKRGAGVIARWTVAAQDWQAFVRNENELSRVKRASRNLVKYKNVNAERDVEILIATDSLLVGNDFHRLDSLRKELKPPTLVESDPVCVHMEVELGDPDDAFVRHALRFPTSRASITHAKQFIATYPC